MSEEQTAYDGPSMGIGLHYDVPMERYLADPCERPSLSKGAMHDLIYRTPAHTWWNNKRLNPYAPDDESARADLGSAVHAAILGGKPLMFFAADDWRTKAAQEWRKGVRETGGIPLLEKNKEEVEGAAAAGKALLQTLPGGPFEWQREGTMVWESDGVLKRGRFDLFCEEANTMVDVKTCTSANPSAWIRTSLSSGGYDLQAEHYLEGIRRLVPALPEGTQFLFLLCELEAPYGCSFVGLDPAFSEFARRKMEFEVKLWKECLASDQWPSYSVYPHWAELRPWDEAELEMKMVYAKEVTS